MKRKYESPVIEVMTAEMPELLAGTEKKTLSTDAYWGGSEFSTIKGVGESNSGTTFTHGQGYNNAGNRAKGNGLWSDDEDEIDNY